MLSVVDSNCLELTDGLGLQGASKKCLLKTKLCNRGLLATRQFKIQHLATETNCAVRSDSPKSHLEHVDHFTHRACCSYEFMPLDQNKNIAAVTLDLS